MAFDLTKTLFDLISDCIQTQSFYTFDIFVNDCTSFKKDYQTVSLKSSGDKDHIEAIFSYCELTFPENHLIIFKNRSLSDYYKKRFYEQFVDEASSNIIFTDIDNAVLHSDEEIDGVFIYESEKFSKNEIDRIYKTFFKTNSFLFFAKIK